MYNGVMPARSANVIYPDGRRGQDGIRHGKIDANADYARFSNADGDVVAMSIATAGHIDGIHIRGTDAGSKFEAASREELSRDVAERLPSEASRDAGVTAFSMEMGKKDEAGGYGRPC
jgi:hypothetical protein